MSSPHPVWCDCCRSWQPHSVQGPDILACQVCGQVSDHSGGAPVVNLEGRPSCFCHHCGVRVGHEALITWSLQDHYCCKDCRRNVHNLPEDRTQQLLGGMPARQDLDH